MIKRQLPPAPGYSLILQPQLRLDRTQQYLPIRGSRSRVNLNLSSRCGPHEIRREKGDMVLDAMTRSLLHGLSGGGGCAAKTDTVGEKRSLRKKGLCANSGSERMSEMRETSVQTSSPGAPFSLMHAKKVIRAASLEEWQKQYAKGSTGCAARFEDYDTFHREGVALETGIDARIDCEAALPENYGQRNKKRINVNPSGRVSSERIKPEGSSVPGTLTEISTCRTILLRP
ncbi:hypothetical protein EVAR_94814_1 [Eumeta japonica]|uniref:Uncharacterized protein n=1 Tax=Eumeta variegata TaxID=151549 RepID=A0A4C1UHB1_EUMVA|nr:hypothetical protein EVAR_94814_1 [Eumeta japonica]